MDERSGYVETAAPSKIILFGEHAVLSGQPALAVALSIGTSCRVFPAHDGQWRINRYSLDQCRDKYVPKAVDLIGEKPLHISTRSNMPSSSGLGSSASITASAVSAILASRDEFSAKECFRISHEVECQTESRSASPLDSACICIGGGIVVNPTNENDDNISWSRGNDS